MEGTPRDLNLTPFRAHPIVTPIDAARTLWADLADAQREEGGYGKRRLEVAAAQFRGRALDN
jgi:hypothetical protein